MSFALSRRGWLAAAGSALAALLAAPGCRPRAAHDDNPDREPLESTGIVDHDGWILTPDDRRKLMTTPVEGRKTP